MKNMKDTKTNFRHQQLRLISQPTNNSRNFNYPQNMHMQNYMAGRSSQNIYNNNNNRLIQAGMISPPMIRKMEKASNLPQYAHIRTMTSQGYYTRSKQAKEMYRVQSVKTKVNNNTKQFIKPVTTQSRKKKNRLKKSHHKSPQLLLKKSKRKSLLRKRETAQTPIIHKSTLTDDKNQSMDEIFKGFRKRTPQNLHKQFMTRTTDDRSNIIKNKPQQKSLFTPNRNLKKQKKSSKSIKKPVQQRQTVTTYKQPPLYTPTRKVDRQQDTKSNMNRRKKDLLSDSSESEDEGVGDLFCFKHPHKKAKYYITKTTHKTPEYLNRMFCSRCAIKLVTKGLMVEELSVKSIKQIQLATQQQEEEEQYQYQQSQMQPDSQNGEEDLSDKEDFSDNREQHQKRQELKLFLDNLNANKQESERCHSTILDKKEELKGYYDNEKQRLEEVFGKLELMIQQEKEKSLRELEDSRKTVFQEFDGIGKELIQNIADMSNIESDINQNIDKIITKIELQDFLEILKKYTLKLDNFNAIKIYLKKEKASIGKFAAVSDRSVSEIQNKLATMFNMSQTNIQYLDTSLQKQETEQNTSVLVSFENKEIFENAIKLSQIELQKQQSDFEQQDQLQRCNFKVKTQQSEDFECDEEKLEFSPQYEDDDMYEENQYEHPMIGDRKVLGEVSLNAKCKTDVKSNRLENTLKKFQSQQNEQQDLTGTIKTPRSDVKLQAFNTAGKNKRYFSIDNSPLSKLGGSQSLMRMNKYKNILNKVNASHQKKEKFYSDLLQDPSPFISPQLQQMKLGNFRQSDEPFIIIEDKVGEDYQSPVFKELKNQEMQRKAQQNNKNQQSENCKNFFQIIEQRINGEEPNQQPKSKYQKTLFL